MAIETNEIERPAARRFVPDYLLHAFVRSGASTWPAKISSYDFGGITLELEATHDLARLISERTSTIDLHRAKRYLHTITVRIEKRFDGNALDCSFELGEPEDDFWIGFDRIPPSHFLIRHPWHSGETIRATLERVAKMKLAVVMPALDLLPGLTLECSIQAPGEGRQSFQARIRKIEPATETIICELELLHPPASLLATIARLSIFDGSIEPLTRRVKAIRAMGYRTREVGDLLAIERCTVNSQAYNDVLRLRLETYRSAGKVGLHYSAEDMADEYDADSTILLARMNREPVGTIRIIDATLTGGNLPLLKYYQRAQVRHIDSPGTIEFSRFAISEVLQHTDVLIVLLRSAFEICLKKDVRVAYLMATSSLKRLYSRIGARTVAEGATHEFLPSEALSLMVFTMSDFRKARRTSMLLWDRIAKQPLEELRRVGLFMPSPGESIYFTIRRNLEQIYLRLSRGKKWLT